MPNNQDQWTAIDNYFSTALHGDTTMLDATQNANNEAGLPEINVAANQGKFLTVLALASGASRILEVGTLGGYSTIWLAHGIPDHGKIVTLELDPHHADVARKNFADAGIEHAIDVRTGKAVDSLKALTEEGTEPFDLVFLDADKASLPDYLAWSLKLARPGTVIVADNVVRHGGVINPDTTDPNAQGVRRYLELAGKEPRLESTAIQTVGSKGYDGFAISVVTG